MSFSPYLTHYKAVVVGPKSRARACNGFLSLGESFVDYDDVATCVTCVLFVERRGKFLAERNNYPEYIRAYKALIRGSEL